MPKTPCCATYAAGIRYQSSPGAPVESSSDAVNRKLAAILAADATNYSGLVAQDEETALRALAVHRAGIDNAIGMHGGRIFATAGDSVLAEFSSPVHAVRAAIAMQRELKHVNAECGLRTPMLFRIGVNVGDVVVDGDNILGNGVNVAVRLENLAPPGGICVSANVRDHVLGLVDCRFQDLGTQFLKNIPRPVRAFHVIAGVSEHRSWHLRRFAPQIAVGAVATLLLAAGSTWLVMGGTPETPAPEQATAAQAAIPNVKREDLLYWESIKQTADPAELRNYLAKYPRGTFAELAQTRLEGILIGQWRSAEEKAAASRRADAQQAQEEAKRMKMEADAAIARAASEQDIVARLRAEADQAAARAVAATKAADEAQQKLARAHGSYAGLAGDRVTLVRTASPLDGRWTAELSCYASADQPMSSTQLPVRILYREIRIEEGHVGLPGYFRAYGSISEEGTFQLQGVSLPRTQRIVGVEDSIKIGGRAIDHNRLEANGTVGERRCSLALNRLAAQ